MRKLLIISLLFLIGCCPDSKEQPKKTSLPDSTGVVQVYAGGWGTGFVVKKIGCHTYWAVTCYHVVKSELAIGVNGVTADVVSQDKIRDIVILRFDSEDKFPVYKLALPNLGEDVIIIGKPPIMTMFGPMMKPIHHKGIISWIQGGQVGVDAGVVSGMSGAPIFNSKGEVVAMVRAQFGGIMTRSEVLGSAINSTEILKVLSE